MSININVFEQHQIDKQIEVLKDPFTFLRDTFFPITEEHSVDSVILDITVDGEKIAPIVSSEDGPVIIKDEGYSSQQVKTPKILMMMPLKPKDFMNNRLAGEVGITTKASKDLQKKFLIKLAKALRALKNRIIRMEEWQAAQALFKGKWEITIPQTGKKYTIDFGRPASHSVTLTGDALITAHSTADLISVLDTKSELITLATGVQPTHVIMDKTSKQNFLKCDSTKEALDNRRYGRGLVDTSEKEMASGAKKFAEIDGFEFFEYSKSYVDLDGNRQPYVPEGEVLLTGKFEGNKRHYGPIEDFDAMPDVERQVFSKNWTEKMPSAWNLSMESHPLLATHMPQIAVSIKAR